VVAEGIETREQQRRLVELGCTRGQGFLYARPAPASAVQALLDGAGAVATA
jgi:EAL domain-containing protein (putative c-di-GMP-specific phosphodiesterase class I)